MAKNMFSNNIFFIISNSIENNPLEALPDNPIYDSCLTMEFD